MKKQNIFLVLVAVAVVGFTSCNGGGVSTATKAPKLSSELDSLNYAYGLANGNDLKMGMLQNAGDSIDKKIATFMKGLNEGLAGPVEKNPQFSGVGNEFGNWLSQQKKVGLLGDSTLKLNYDLVKQGVINSILKSKAQMTSEQAQEYLNKTMMARQEQALLKQHGAKKIAGEKFLAENGKRAGVVTTPSGLQYEVIKAGNGPKPTLNDMVKVNYVGTLIDGKEFDSSVKRGQPATFGVGQVIKGWTEGLQLMPVGSKYKLYVPYTLAYGAKGTPEIPPFSTLIFDVELLEIVKK
ncbi:MAG: FKBP-type peptidyl-prolyl cis-trans isomerase [Paludibacteraceae bacterium]